MGGVLYLTLTSKLDSRYMKHDDCDKLHKGMMVVEEIKDESHKAFHDTVISRLDKIDERFNGTDSKLDNLYKMIFDLVNKAAK